MSSRLDELRFDLASDLEQIKRRFLASARPKVTLVIRNEGLEDGDLVIGDDDLDKAIEAIRELQSQPPIGGAA